MVPAKAFGRMARAIDRNKTWIMVASVLAFISFRVLKAMGTFSFLDWLGQSSAFAPGLIESGAFAASLAFIFLSHRYSSRLEGRAVLAVIFMSGLFLAAGFTLISQPKWSDSRGYHELGVYGAVNGPLALVRDYHTLNTLWPERTIQAYSDELSGLGLLDWGMGVLRPEPGEPNIVSSRIQQHPPLYPVVLAVGMLALGVSGLASLIVTWIIFALIPVVLFLAASRHAGREPALRLSFVSMLIPVMLLSANEPVMDGLVTLLVLASFLFFTGGKPSMRDIAISGLLLALALFTKLTVLFIFPLFLAIILIRQDFMTKWKSIAAFLAPLILVSLLFMSQGYYFFLTMITAKASMGARIDVNVKNSVITYAVLPVYYTIYFGLPVLILLARESLADLAGKLDRKALTRILSAVFLIGFMFLYPNKLGLERLMMPFLFICLAMHSKQLSGHLRNDRIFLLVMALMLIQSLGFLI